MENGSIQLLWFTGSPIPEYKTARSDKHQVQKTYMREILTLKTHTPQKVIVSLMTTMIMIAMLKVKSTTG